MHGELVITQGHVAFVPNGGAPSLVLDVQSIVAVRTKRYMAWNTKTDNSLELTRADGSAEQLDGFWERDECLNLILAAGRFCGHSIAVGADADGQPPVAGGPARAAASGRSGAPLPPPPPAPAH